MGWGMGDTLYWIWSELRALLAKFWKGRCGDGHRTRGELKNRLRCLKKSEPVCTLVFLNV